MRSRDIICPTLILMMTLIDDNDNGMTFFETNVYLRPCSVICHLRPSRDRKKVAILSFFEAEVGNEVVPIRRNGIKKI